MRPYFTDTGLLCSLVSLGNAARASAGFMAGAIVERAVLGELDRLGGSGAGMGLALGWGMALSSGTYARGDPAASVLYEVVRDHQSLSMMPSPSVRLSTGTGVSGASGGRLVCHVVACS